MSVFYGPQGRLRDAETERKIVRMSLVDAWGFEYYAPAELGYSGTDGPDWWSVFWTALERHHDKTLVSGQRSLDEFAAATGGASA